MPRYGQLVIGPAGSGKSTYCANVQKHLQVTGRTCHVVNLDPAAESFSYSLLADVRDLIHVEDAMDDEELALGPNGGLIFCMEYLASNPDWLLQAIDDDIDDDYILFDCPGQVELYSHLPVMQQIVEVLQRHCDFRLCAVFLLDSQFLVEPHKFVAGGLAALSAMVALELPFVAVMSKVDLLSSAQKKRLDRFLEPDFSDLLCEGEGLLAYESSGSDKESDETDEEMLGAAKGRVSSGDFGHGPNPGRYAALGRVFANLIEDYSMLRFHAFDISDESSVEEVVGSIDAAIQYGEDKEPRMRDPPEEDEED